MATESAVIVATTSTPVQRRSPDPTTVPPTSTVSTTHFAGDSRSSSARHVSSGVLMAPSTSASIMGSNPHGYHHHGGYATPSHATYHGTAGSIMMTSGNRYYPHRTSNNTVIHSSTPSTYPGPAGGDSHITYGESHILCERVVEHEVRVPKKVVREDIVERVIVVPEKVVHEEVIEDLTTVRQKVIEIAKPIYHERIIEVPEIEYIERIVEIPEVILQEKIREVPRLEIQERIIEVPKIITEERIVEIPEIEYIDVPYEKIVEVPEVYEQIVLKHIPVPQFIERPVPEFVNVEVEQEVVRHVPVPIEAITTIELKVPQLRPRYTRYDLPLYVPRFVEVAMPAELMDPAAIAEAEHYAQQVSVIASQSAASLCEIERLAGTLKDLDQHYSAMAVFAGEHGAVNVANAWAQGRFGFDGDFRDVPSPNSPISKAPRDGVINDDATEDCAAPYSASDVPAVSTESAKRNSIEPLAFTTTRDAADEDVQQQTNTNTDEEADDDVQNQANTTTDEEAGDDDVEHQANTNTDEEADDDIRHLANTNTDEEDEENIVTTNLAMTPEIDVNVPHFGPRSDRDNAV